MDVQTKIKRARRAALAKRQTMTPAERGAATRRAYGNLFYSLAKVRRDSRAVAGMIAAIGGRP